MLDPWIIDEIRRREDQRRERDARHLELPIYNDRQEEPSELVKDHDEPKRGVVVIDL